MNIGFFFNGKLYPPKAGGNVHTYQIVKQLTQRGHKVSTLFYDQEDPFMKVYHRRDVLKFLYDIDLLYIRLHGTYAQERFSRLKMLRPNLPLVWEINAPLEEGILVGKSKEMIDRLVQKRKRLARYVNAATCVSKELKDYAVYELGIKDVTVVPNGSDPDLFSPRHRDPAIFKECADKFKVLWMGTTHFKWHGVEQIFEVAKKIYAQDKNIIFIIIGDKRNIQVPEDAKANVVVFDQIEYLKLPPYVASADAGLCFYYDEEQGVKFYRSPLKLFDYMASGLPVMATKIGQITEIIEDGVNGLLIEQNKMDEIVQKIIFLKNNLSQAQAIGQKARASVESYYNWARAAEETEEVFKVLIRK